MKRENTVQGRSVAVRGAVLAGGDSRRFGTDDKALANVDGQPLLRRVTLRVERALGSAPYVVVGDAEREGTYRSAVPANVEFVYDDPDRTGPIAGLAGALAATEGRWLFLAAGDMPFLSPAAVCWVCSERTASTDAVLPVVDDVPQPHHALYRTRALRETIGTLSPDAGLRTITDGLTVTNVAPSDAPESVPLRRSVIDVDTRDDLRTVRRMRNES